MTPASTIWDESRLADPHAQPDKARRIESMFDAIAPTYERVNRVLSLGRDALWRRRAVDRARIRPDDRVLDLACGTGDFARAFAAAGPDRVVATDFSEQMLRLAPGRDHGAIRWCRADALHLPFPDQSFTIATCAFGIRNFQSLEVGLREMHRVLAPDGRAVVLEFSVPGSAIPRAAYLFYFRHVLPRLARWISRDRSGAYQYLPSSVLSFQSTPALIDSFRVAGFQHVESCPLTFGIVTIFIARKN